MLIFDKLKIGYDKPLFEAALDTNFDSGDFVVLLGRNGAGKTTLLKTLSGDLNPKEGAVVIDSMAMHKAMPEQKSRLLSMVTTERCLTPYMKIEDLIALGRFPYLNFWGKLRKEDQDLIEHTIELLDIGHLKGKYITDCSEGEHQLVQIARAFVQDTPVILLDEATAHLDFVNRIRLFERLKQLSVEQNKLILFASHELEMALQFASKIILFTGKTLVVDEPVALIEKGLIQAVFTTEGLSYQLNLKKITKLG